MDDPALRMARYRFEQVLSAKLTPQQMTNLKQMLLLRAVEELVIPLLVPGQAVSLVFEPWRLTRKLDSPYEWLTGELGVALTRYEAGALTTAEASAPLTRDEFATTWGLQTYPARETAITMARAVAVRDHEVWVVYFPARAVYGLMLRAAVEAMIARELLGPENVVWTPPGAAPWVLDHLPHKEGA